MPTFADYLRNLTSSDPDNPLGDQSGEALARVRAMRRDAATKILRETPEIVATLGTGMVAQPIAGLHGLATLARGGGLDEATKNIKSTQENLTYEPKSEGAQQGLGLINDVIEPVAKLAREHIADPVGAVSPVLGAALVALPDALPGPKGVKGAVEVAGKAAKAAKAAARGVETAEAAAAPVAAAGGLGERLRAVGDARRAHAAEATSENADRLKAAEDALRVHRERRAAAAAPADDPLAAAQRAHNANPTRETKEALRTAIEGFVRPDQTPVTPPAFDATDATRAALRAIHGADADGVSIPGGQNGRNEAFERARQAASDAMRSGQPFEHAETAAHAAVRDAAAMPGEPTPPRSRAASPKVQAYLRAIDERVPADPTPTPLPGSTEGIQQARTAALRDVPDEHRLSPEHEARLTEVDPGEWLTTRRKKAEGGAVDDYVIDARARLLTRRLLGDVNEYGTEFLNTFDTLRARIAHRNPHANRGAGVFAGEDWIPEREPTPPPAWTPPAMSATEQKAHAVTLEEIRRHQQAGSLTPGLAFAYDRRLERIRNGSMPAQVLEGIAQRSFQSVDDLRRVPPTGAPQHDLLPRVDPGWEHQKLIPGLTPLSQDEGMLMARRRLGARTRILRRGDPAMNRESVMAFYEGGRDNPDMFQYGVDPKRTGEVGRHASLEDYADVYNQRIPEANINIERRGGDIDYDNIDFEEPDPEYLRHGHGEPMRDRHGDYKQEKKKHAAGDVPVYGPEGDVKKNVIGFTTDKGPKKEKYVARGGEIVRTPRDRWGGGGEPKYTEILSEGGERMRDESGSFKTDAEHDPDAYQERRDQAYQDAVDNAPSEDETIRMSAAKGGEIDVSGLNDSELGVYAGANRGPYGSLLYQTLLNHAAHSGEKIGGSGLTNINALRILSNANSNFARTGINPRGLAGTASGDLPNLPNKMRAHETFAEGPEIWRSESDEALKRAMRGGGKPERMGFDPEVGFTLDGMPATQDMLKTELRSMTPDPKNSGVGIKTLMRSAVFDWVRDATPEQAAHVAKNWSKKYGPLFGVAGVGFTLQQALREKADEGVQ